MMRRMLTAWALAMVVVAGWGPGESHAQGVAGETAAGESAGETAAGASAAGETAVGDDATVPTVLHTPVLTAAAGEAMVIRAEVVGDWRLAELVVRYRPAGNEWQSVPLERSREGDWRASIPAVAVRAAGLDYSIESRDHLGVVRRHFASIEAPHPVRVEGMSEADTEVEQLARYRGHRARLRVDGSLVAYGTVQHETASPTGGAVAETDRFSDHYWRAEAEFVYRPLTILHDFRFGVGVMRAAWPAVDGEAIREAEEPGVNYGFGEINFELHRWFSVGGRLILGASDQGFTAGVGGIGRIGDMAGTHFAAMVEVIGDVGQRTDLRFHWDTVPRVPMALGIEFTDWPSEHSSAANLSFDLGVEVDAQWTVTARVGTANRAGSLTGGWQGGLGVLCDF